MINMLLKFAAAALFVAALQANDFENYKQSQTNSYSSYKQDLQKEFETFQKVYREEFAAYKKQILQIWDKPETTSKTKWVQYGDDFKERVIADFDKEELSLAVSAKDEENALKRLQDLQKESLNKSVEQAYQEDKVEKRVYQKLGKTRKKNDSTQQIIGDIVPQKNIKKKDIQKKKGKNGEFIYLVKIDFPAGSMQKKASQYKSMVLQNARKYDIKPHLVYAIIHSESSYNPMAKSHIPAYGLMQIVPKSAGIDSYNFIYGKKRLVSSSYLYNERNNIKLGSAYLHILYYRYLKDVKNPTNRLYCTIAAYNTGAGNVAKVFTGNYNIKKAAQEINKLQPQQLYDILISKLPYDETKRYLKKVTSRYVDYQTLVPKL